MCELWIWDMNVKYYEMSDGEEERNKNDKMDMLLISMSSYLHQSTQPT